MTIQGLSQPKPRSVVDMNNLSKISTIKTYANSYARMKFFQRHFSSTHPTCEAEVQILGLNESQLRFNLIDRFSIDEIQQLRPEIEKKILQFIKIKLKDITDDVTTIDAIMNSIKSSEFDCLFQLH